MNVSTSRTKLIQNGHTILNVKIYPCKNHETIILLHGGPGVPDDMLEVVEQLKNKYQIITFEQRGVGLSKNTNCKYQMEAYISDIDVISKNLKIESFHLFGHSWGGLYAQIYAEVRPHKIKSLFLCSPSSGTNNTWKQTEKEVMHFNKKNAAANEWTKMGWYSLLGMFGNDKAYQKLFKLVLKNYHKHYGKVHLDNSYFEKIHAAPVNKTRKEILNYKSLSIFKKPNYPVIITYGEHDIYGKSKTVILNRFPTAKIETIEECGHIPWKQNLKDFNCILNKFYSK